MTTRSAASRGLQHWLESRAAGPAFLIAAVCVMARGATFWSGGAFTVAGLLGAGGLRWFNGLTGIGIAVGAELLTSVFGRQWLRYEAEKHEAQGRGGLRRGERDALVKLYTFHARISQGFMAVGIAASTAAAFMFLATSTAASGWALAGEAVIALVLVVIMTGFGVFYQDRPDADQSERTMTQARALRGRAMEGAGERISRGEYTAQDVRLVAGELRDPHERDRFMAALLPPTADDPLVNVNEMADWLGWTSDAGRKKIQRRLRRLADAGEPVTRDPRKGYLIPRSAFVRAFASDFLATHRRQDVPSVPRGIAATRDSDKTPTERGQDADSPASVALAAGYSS